MKHFYSVLAFLLLVSSCQQPDSENLFTYEQFKTVAESYGWYTLTKADWEYPICLSENDNDYTYDILSQLKKYGFYGTQTITRKGETENISVFERSSVLVQHYPNEKAQVNLQIPLFLIDEDHNANGYTQTELGEGKCAIYMSVYQFHYQVMTDGRIETDYQSYWHLVSNTVPYYEVNIYFQPGVIELTARTQMYDYRTGKWQAGRITCRYERNQIAP